MPAIKNEKFLIMRLIKDFILGLEKLLINFPKKDFISKDKMYSDATELLEIVIKANYETEKRVKKTYQIEALAKVNKLDFYLERAYKMKYISEKQCTLKSNELLKINKMIYMWCKNEE